ncbi:MAG: Glycosyl transferase, group 1 [Parcubacteria group bacterium GW2011_GWB1_42_6]|nr:MAG: Glycosyl transferase, group 1 [Parcubacteria group bacterium GW2011_GWB1_42_6]
MKKVLIFSTAYLPMIGGAEIAVKEITDRLKDWEFDLVCARIKKDLPEREKIGRVNVWRAGKGRGKRDKFLFPWLGFRLAQKLYGQNKYDLVWAIMASFGGLAALLFKGQFSGVPYVLTLQEGDSLEHIKSRSKWLGFIYKKIFQRADHITAISVYLKEYAKSQGVSEEKISVAPNGVDFNKFSLFRCAGGAAEGRAIFKIAELKKKLGIKGDEKIIITVSRLVEKNGIGDLIEAMEKIKIPARLLILGSGPLEKDLKSLAEKSDLKEKILFLGEKPNEEVPLYLALADVFCRPSLSEGLGNSFLEAMAAGVPVVGAKVGGIPDFLKDPSADSAISSRTSLGQATGLFCETKNPADIAEKIMMIFEDEKLRLELIKNAGKMVREKYDWKIISEQMEGIFKGLTD